MESNLGRYREMSLSRKSIIAALVIANLGALGFAGNAATGGDVHELIQKRRSFGTDTLTINAGDSVSFVNGDPYAHNVYSRKPKGWLDLGIQEEGEQTAVVFDTPGLFDIRCRIHPKMRVTVSVR
jgi:plastocyanin